MNQFTLDIEKQLANFGREIQNVIEKVAPSEQNRVNFEPTCDLIERAESLLILMDLPGMKKEMIKITLKNRVLTISGERELYLEDGETLLRSERKEGAFSRSFPLPEDADPKSIEAKFQNGVLNITIATTRKGQEADPETIPVR